MRKQKIIDLQRKRIAELEKKNKDLERENEELSFRENARNLSTDERERILDEREEALTKAEKEINEVRVGLRAMQNKYSDLLTVMKQSKNDFVTNMMWQLSRIKKQK